MGANFVKKWKIDEKQEAFSRILDVLTIHYWVDDKRIICRPFWLRGKSPYCLSSKVSFCVRTSKGNLVSDKRAIVNTKNIQTSFRITKILEDVSPYSILETEYKISNFVNANFRNWQWAYTVRLCFINRQTFTGTWK